MPTPEQLKMARRIAAHALCGPEKWKPGVKAGIYEEIMRGDADAEALVQGPLAAIIETTEAAALFCRGWLSSAPSAAKPIRDFEHLKRHLSMTEPAHSRPDGSAFSQEEHDRYVIRDDVPPTVHARMNSVTGRWESPVDVRTATPKEDNPDGN